MAKKKDSRNYSEITNDKFEHMVQEYQPLAQKKLTRELPETIEEVLLQIKNGLNPQFAFNYIKALYLMLPIADKLIFIGAMLFYSPLKYRKPSLSDLLPQSNQYGNDFINSIDLFVQEEKKSTVEVVKYMELFFRNYPENIEVRDELIRGLAEKNKKLLLVNQPLNNVKLAIDSYNKIQDNIAQNKLQFELMNERQDPKELILPIAIDLLFDVENKLYLRKYISQDGIWEKSERDFLGYIEKLNNEHYFKPKVGGKEVSFRNILSFCEKRYGMKTGQQSEPQKRHIIVKEKIGDFYWIPKNERHK